MKLATAIAIAVSSVLTAAQELRPLLRAGVTLSTTISDATALDDAAIVGGNDEVALGSKSHEDIGDSPYDLEVEINIFASDIRWAGTTDAPRIQVVPGNRVNCNGYSGCNMEMSCTDDLLSIKKCNARIVLQLKEHSYRYQEHKLRAELVESFQVHATGGDAMMVDSANMELVEYIGYNTVLGIWGTPNNNHGWCLSTESSDYDGNDYRHGNACRCRLEFRSNDLAHAWAWTSCS